MSLWQGVLGAQVELSRLSRPADRLGRLAGIARLFAEEIAGTVALAPYGARAALLHRRLPAWRPADDGASGSAAAAEEHALRLEPAIDRAVRYLPQPGPPRCVVDVYVPPPGAAAAAAAAASGRSTSTSTSSSDGGSNGSGGGGLPVVLFCHGGVWAAGEAWHYAPMAASLARLGVLVAVMQYSLYPDALVPAMVGEVDAALTWAFANCSRYGGDPGRVSLVGHSAGAQLCAMALLQRAAAAHARGGGGGSSSSTSSGGGSGSAATASPPDVRMPRRFVGVAGVYDIARHYEYEFGRGVHELSTMKRAVGGLARAAAVSPSVVLGAALERARRGEAAAAAEAAAIDAAAVSRLRSGRKRRGRAAGAGASGGDPYDDLALRFYEEFPLAGEAVAHRIGFDRGSAHHAAREALLADLALAGAAAAPALPLAAAARLPPAVLMSSCADVTVPWFESAELFHRLVDAGVPAKHLVYNKVGHGDFVVDWPARSRAPEAAADEDDEEEEDEGGESGYDSDDWGSGGGGGGGGSRSDGGGGGGDEEAVGGARWWARRQAAELRMLRPYCRDLAAVVADAVEVDYVVAGAPPAAAGGGGGGGSVTAGAGVGAPRG